MGDVTCVLLLMCPECDVTRKPIFSSLCLISAQSRRGLTLTSCQRRIGFSVTQERVSNQIDAIKRRAREVQQAGRTSVLVTGSQWDLSMQLSSSFRYDNLKTPSDSAGGRSPVRDNHRPPLHGAHDLTDALRTDASAIVIGKEVLEEVAQGAPEEGSNDDIRQTPERVSWMDGAAALPG